MKNLWITCALALSALPMAQASLLLSESFDYAEGSATSTWNSGTGFANGTSWNASSVTDKAIVEGLTFGSLVTSGGALEVGYTGTSASLTGGMVSRKMGLGQITQGDIWISYLYKYDTSAAGPLDEVQLELRPTAGNIRTGIAENANQGFYERYGASTTTSAANAVFKDGTTLLLIFYFPELGAGTAREAQGFALTEANFELLIGAGLSLDNLLLYADANIVRENSSAVTLNGDGNFEIVPLARGNGSNGSFIVDELKIGTTLQDVIAYVPEGAYSAWVLALGAFVLALRAYRRK